MTPAKKQTKAEPTPATMATTAKPETPKIPASTTPPPQPTTATKQQATVAKLREAWTAKGIDLSKLTEKVDGKYVVLQLPNFPECRIGPSGGLEVALPSYPQAFAAAVNGDVLLAKLRARQSKKQSATSAPAATAKPQSPAPVAKPETPTAKKQKANAAIEAQLEARA